MRSSFARPIYLQIRRVMQHHASHKPGGVSRTAIISQRRLHAKVDTRIRSPRCSSPASSRPCTSRAAACGIPRAISSARSSFASTGPGPLRVPSCALKRKAGSQPTPGPTCHSGGGAVCRRRRRRHRLARPARQLRALRALFADEVLSDEGRQQLNVDQPNTRRGRHPCAASLSRGHCLRARRYFCSRVDCARRTSARTQLSACVRAVPPSAEARQLGCGGQPLHALAPAPRACRRRRQARAPVTCANQESRPFIGHRGRDRQGWA